MDIYCLKGGQSQSDEERRISFELLRKSLPPEAEGDPPDTHLESGQEGRIGPFLEMLTSGPVADICFKEAQTLARTEADVARLEKLLPELELSLVVTHLKDDETGDGQHHRDDGPQGQSNSGERHVFSTECVDKDSMS